MLKLIEQLLRNLDIIIIILGKKVMKTTLLKMSNQNFSSKQHLDWIYITIFGTLPEWKADEGTISEKKITKYPDKFLGQNTLNLWL